MHELPVIGTIIKMVLKHAEANGAQQVVAVHLEVGELSDLEDRWMQRYFDHLANNTIAAGARLKIVRIPVIMRCLGCSHQYKIELEVDEQQRCPQCDSRETTMISGREYTLKNLEVI